jgi:hypothetical protein
MPPAPSNPKTPAESAEVLVAVRTGPRQEIRIARLRDARAAGLIEVRELRVVARRPHEWSRRKGFRLEATPEALRQLADGLAQVADRLEAERAEARPESTGVAATSPWRRPLSAGELAEIVAARRKQPAASGG